MIRFVRPATAVALLLSAASASIAETDTLRGRGNEPFWSVEKTAESITFRPMDGEPATVSPVPTPRKDGNADIYEATVSGETFVLTIADTVCTDTMSGMPFPKSVTVALGAKTFSGCGGEPVTLLLGEWMIAEIDGKPAVAGSTPTIRLEPDGTLNGNGSCNRFFGSYALTGEGLTVGDFGSSMMMCEEPLMHQERAVLDILKAVGGFAIGEDGALILRGGDGRTITARPVP
ncbi:MAG: META domain-containing protein [Labrys sp. (in: a-proteobacteria)]|jgi:heat shock protein HslJ